MTKNEIADFLSGRAKLAEACGEAKFYVSNEVGLEMADFLRAAAEPSGRPIYINRAEAEFIDDACLKDGAAQWHSLQDQVREKFGMATMDRGVEV